MWIKVDGISPKLWHCPREVLKKKDMEYCDLLKAIIQNTVYNIN